MRLPVFRCSLVLGALALGAAWGAAATAAHPPASLTLYEKADFAGRSVTFHSAVATARQAFAAHSAKSVGLWTLCEGRDPASKCQTVTGASPRLKIEPAIVRPGVDAVALYEEPNLKGRRTVYSFASDQPPPFQPKSARTWGGPWTLCDATAGHCQTIDGEHPAAVEVQVATAQPGRPAARLQLALASPPPEPEAVASEPPPQDLPPPPAAPPEAAAPPPPPPPVMAEAAPSPRAEPAPSPYVDIPLPPREREVVREVAPPPPAAQPDVRIAAPRPVSAVRRVAYACEDGRGLTVLFDDRDETAMVLAGGQDPVALRRGANRDEGGFFYEGAGHVLFGAGARAGYATDGARPVDCYASAARRQLSYRDEPRSAGQDRDAAEPDDGPGGDVPGR